MADATRIEEELPDPGRGCPPTPTTSPDPDRYRSGDAEGSGIHESMPDQATDRTGTNDFEPKTENQTQIRLDQGQIKLDPDAKLPICPTEGVEQRDPPAEGPAATTSQDAEEKEVEIYYHDSGDLSAEDLEGNLAVLPKIPISTTAKVSIEDLQVGDSRSATPEEIERLRQIIWNKQHLLSERERLTPGGQGRRLIKGLLTAEIIRPSTSPWASPIVIVHMASGFWVVPMTDRAREISPFITPFGLFEWSRMPFGLKNAPQIYQRLVDNALYGFLKISRSGDAGATTDGFQTGIADDPGRESVLGRKSYTDDIMIAAKSWDQLCRRVENLLEANPKDLKSLTDLPFPGSLRSMQSFLGSLNYYSRFIEDYAIYALVLYELREVEFAELEKRSDLREILDRNDPIPRDHDPPERKLTGPLDERWIRAHRAFIVLKTKIATTPVLRHFDETRTPVVIIYASDWAISASLTQEHDGIYHPVAFASRTLKTNELNYNVTEKEVLALLRILDLYYNLLVGREIRVLTRHSTLALLFKSTGLQGRLGNGTDTHGRSRREIMGDQLDGSARVKCGGGAFSAIVWSLPGWEVVKARSGYLESLTVNEAEYNGLILELDMLESLDRRRLVVCGDSNLVIGQVQGEIDCKAPGLTLLKRKALDRLRKWSDHELVHVKRYWNGSADSLASTALQRQRGIEVQEGPGYQDLVTLNRLGEILIPKTENPVITQAQEEEVWIAGMKKYLSGSIADLTQAEARSYGKISADYE
ncbi:reverse transcriptase, partial [Phytophthora megakarya]